MKNTLFFFNPNSQEGNAPKLWKKARNKYHELPERPLDITQVDVEEAIVRHKPEVVVVAGGDGTINSVCTHISTMKDKPKIAIMPMGHGNALAYCFGVDTIDKAMSVINEQKHTVTVDLMQTNIPNHPVGVFNISVGYDARIVHHRQRHKYIGVRSYILSALRSFVSHAEQEITLTIDKEVKLTARASSLVIANCPIIGQNYIISPKAKMNDGLLDCTLFSTKYDYITNLRFRGFKHPLYNELGKVRFKAKHIRIEGEPFVQIDGDPVVEKEGVEISIVPDQLTFLRNQDNQINQVTIPYVTEKTQ